MRIIKVEETDMMGYSGNTKYFKVLKKAKKYFKKLFNNNKVDLVEEGSYQEEPVFFRNFQSTPILKGKRYKEASMECWYSSETDCGTEWDTSIISVVLEEIEVEQ